MEIGTFRQNDREFYELLCNGLFQKIVRKSWISRISKEIRFVHPILTIFSPSDPNSRRGQDSVLGFPQILLKTLFRKICVAKFYKTNSENAGTIFRQTLLKFPPKFRQDFRQKKAPKNWLVLHINIAVTPCTTPPTHSDLQLRGLW